MKTFRSKFYTPKGEKNCELLKMCFAVRVNVKHIKNPTNDDIRAELNPPKGLEHPHIAPITDRWEQNYCIKLFRQTDKFIKKLKTIKSPVKRGYELVSWCQDNLTTLYVPEVMYDMLWLYFNKEELRELREMAYEYEDLTDIIYNALNCDWKKNEVGYLPLVYEYFLWPRDCDPELYMEGFIERWLYDGSPYPDLVFKYYGWEVDWWQPVCMGCESGYGFEFQYYIDYEKNKVVKHKTDKNYEWLQQQQRGN